ncbi:SH3 domain-binding protein 5-like protein [Trichinella spiralis]|uniref:SH3 domain-binding protein 5-like protein n=1 Tax=Trichinella spiralis TaxID=6334 RepID=UPI0001EFB846|nr:SH3 domain-binding protein 5-like protein [Trichinella spiralis]
MNKSTDSDSPSESIGLSSPTQTMAAGDLNRVHEELEKLNIATDVINKLELQLDEAQTMFRDAQSSWTQKLSQMAKKLGTCIEKSRPYYEARIKVLEAQQEAQRAALRFERANRMHSIAKQQVTLTQESLNRQGTEHVDPACLEVLNHHNKRVNEAEWERLQSEKEHEEVSRLVESATKQVSALETKVEFMRVLQNQKALIQRLQAEIRQKKSDYNTSLRNLERISEEIHEKRSLGKRDPGVGSESPGPPCTSVNADSSDSRILDANRSPVDRMRFISSLNIEDLVDSVVQSGDASASATHHRVKASSPALLIYPLTKNSSSTSNAGLNSGVILLAHELACLSNQPYLSAFQLAPEELDVEYHTAPQGVSSSGRSSPVSSSKNEERSTATPDLKMTLMKDERVKELMVEPEELIDQIDHEFDDARLSFAEHSTSKD